MALRPRMMASVGAFLMLTGVAACDSGGAEFPSDRFELIVPYNPGGSNDTAGRLLASELEAISGQQVVVVNRPGGGAAVGITEAMSAPADGYNMVITPNSAFASVPLVQEVSYTPEDFRSVGPLYDQPHIIVSHKDSDIQSLDDLEQVTDRITYTILAQGHVTHLSLGNVLNDMGLEAEPVPYDSAADSLQAVTSGQVDVGIIDMNIAVPQVESGDVTALAINTEERHPAFPDIESLVEAGYPDGAGYLSRNMISVPADTPDDVATELQSLLTEAYESDAYQQFMEENYLLEPEYEGAAFIDEFIPEERERLVTAFADLGIERIDG